MSTPPKTTKVLNELLKWLAPPPFNSPENCNALGEELTADHQRCTPSKMTALCARIPLTRGYSCAGGDLKSFNTSQPAYQQREFCQMNRGAGGYVRPDPVHAAKPAHRSASKAQHRMVLAYVPMSRRE
jgi:hypothetical protein